MPPNTIIFDLDGTLIDSAPGITAAINTVLQEIGRPALGIAEVKRMIGDGGRRTVEQCLDATGGRAGIDMDAVVARWIRAYTEDEIKKTAAFAAVLPTLERLVRDGFRLGLCTNKSRAATLPLLDTVGLAPFFRAVVTPDDVPFRKPDGRHILATVAAMEARPAESVYIGDSEIDAAAAKSAGLAFILVTFGYPRGPLTAIRADATLDDFGELPGILRRLG